jgi:hypothetical protein
MSLFTVDDSYIEEQQHHHHAPPNGQSSTGPDDVRPHHAFPGYPSPYPPNSSISGSRPSMAPALHDGMLHRVGSSHAIAASSARAKSEDDDNASLFGDIPEARKRKFILVEDPSKNGNRVRVRVTLDTVDTAQIPDSYRKTNSVYPRSWFPMQMQSPPPSAHGSRFFEDDDVDDLGQGARGEGEHDGDGRSGRPAAFGKTMVQVPVMDGGVAEVAVPKTRRTQRGKEVKLNDLGYRMAWQQSRVFAGKAVFLQRARESPLLCPPLSPSSLLSFVYERL